MDCSTLGVGQSAASRRLRVGRMSAARSSWRSALRNLLTASGARLLHRVACRDAAVLRNLFASIEAQTTPIPVHLSWSASVELQTHVRDLVRNRPWLRSIEQATPHSQFEHFHQLVLSLVATPPQWLIFSDDDDLWSVRRAELFAKECADATKSRVVLCRCKARPAPTVGVRQLQPTGFAPSKASPRDVCEPGSADDVDALLATGRAVYFPLASNPGLALHA